MQPSTKLNEWCELSRYHDHDSRLSLILKNRIDGYNNHDLLDLQKATKQRKQYIERSKNVKEFKMLGEQEEEYLDDLLHPQMIYTKPKKPTWQQVREPYGKDIFVLDNYNNSFLANIRNNVVTERLLGEVEVDTDLKPTKNTTNYVKDFFDKFGHILKKQSPEFWQLNFYDILTMVANKKKDSQQLQQEMWANIPDASAIKYLLTYRPEIVQYLEESDYFNKNTDHKNLIDNMTNDDEKLPAGKKKPKEKPVQQLSRFLLTEELAEVDFLKMKDNELVSKIPTSSRNDGPQMVYFCIGAMPKVSHNVELVRIDEKIKPEYRPCFESAQLNVIQSLVFQHAYHSNQNMLVCAPTGAGKTNIATLTILNVINRFKDDFKVIYISPMKALANELVQKFTQKFKNYKTRQMTGDIQLSQKELATTHIIVTTPEKLDVVTRKNTALMEEVKLVIFDEVHLLNDERGWVLESLIARLFRSVFRTQKTIRIIGLSATLPNYTDVADFLKVKESGLFHFDSSYRPVPLKIHFYGIKAPTEQSGSTGRKRRSLDIYNQKCYEYCMKHLRNHKQVLVFVHSRKQTVNYCKFIMNRAVEVGDEGILGQSQKMHVKYKLTDKQLIKVSQFCVAFHHAGMVRSDRNEVQRMFRSGDAKILVATATLAWGVNLPAYAVIIKGTDIYDVNMCQSRDLSILDVQQMFGRAGRPQYDDTGEAALMTDFKKVNKYIGALTSTVPIESKFTEFLKEALNAEICSGTVTNEHEAFEWLKYTFFAIRCMRNPRFYGCPVGQNEVEQQFRFDEYLRNKIVHVIKQLDALRLIRYDTKSLFVSSTELGRITSHFYIKCQTMEHFCNQLHLSISHQNPTSIKKKYDYKSDLQLLNILVHCKEFENIRVRPEEMEELKNLMNYWLLDEQPDFGLPGRGGPKNVGNYAEELIIEGPQKILLLLQGYLRDLFYDNYSLTNDTQYIVQQSVRLLRCLFDLCCKKNQAMNVQMILKWCKYIENRIYEIHSPLRQFCKISFSGYNSMRVKKEGFMNKNHYEDMEKSGLTVNQALELGSQNLKAKMGSSVGESILNWSRKLPRVSVAYKIKPIAQTILKVDVEVTPKFEYDHKWHLKSEVFWVFFDDEEQILHSQSFLMDQYFMKSRQPVSLSFFIPYRDSTKKLYRLLIRSDRWLMDNQDEVTYVNLQELGIEMDTLPFTPLLNLQPLPKTALKNPLFESLYTKFNFFNPIQTQLFFSLYHTDNNILIGAPTGSGKTIMSELAILRLFSQTPDKKVVYVAPLKSLAKERLQDWIPRFEILKKSVVELTGDYTPDIESLNKAHVIITTPEKWDGITRNKERQYTQNVGLIIFDQIHLLGQDRGAVIEVIVSRMNKDGKVRMVGLSTAMANGGDVAEWFGTGPYGFFNFKPSVRPVPIEIHFEGFSQKNYCPRMATMNKPAYNHIKKFSEGKPVLIFVSSRRQTRLTALDLIALSQHDSKGATPFIKCNHDELHWRIDEVADEYLKQTLSFGIGMHHAGLNTNDRKVCQDLFLNNKIQILIATSTLAWGVNFPARLVIIKGTEYFDPKTHRYVDFPATDLLQMIGRAGRPQFDNKGVAVVYCEQSKKMFYRRYLNDPFPIESSLIEQLDDHINAEIANGTIRNKQDCINWFTWSYAFRRIMKNPNFYGIEDNKNNSIKKFLIDLVDKSIGRLEASGCVKSQDDIRSSVNPTELGFIAATYYLRHQTVKYFREHLKGGMTFRDVLWTISHAEEFLETPLRHNEDNFNEELSSISPYKIREYSSPQAKTFLLFQMHLFDLPPPIRDYVTDAKLILDASARVVMGAIAIAKEMNILDTLLSLIFVGQLLVQGMQCNIPYVSQEHWERLKKQLKYQNLAQMVEQLDDNKVQRDIVGQLRKYMGKSLTKDKESQIVKALLSFPKMRVEASILPYDDQEMKVIENGIIIEGADEAVVRLNIEKENKAPNRIVVQKGNKIKDASWWLVVAIRNSILAIKKAIISHKKQIDIRICLPEKFRQAQEIKIYMLSDCYVGLDQELSIDLLEFIQG